MKWFRNLKIGKKLNMIIILMIVLVVAVAVGFSIMEFTNMNIKQAQEQSQKGVAGMAELIDNQKANAIELSKLFAANPDIIEGTLNGSRDALKNALEKIASAVSVDSITVLDKAGTVILRTSDTEKFGDSLAGQEDISKAMSGEPAVSIEKGIDSSMSINAGCPITDTQGNIIGVVSTGVRLDNSELLDSLKEIYKTEMTIFQDDIRIATTIVNNGQRVVGTTLDPAVADIVLKQKRVYAGDANILGKKYITYYSPILSSDGNAIGILFAGQPIDEFYQQLNQIILIVLVISAVSVAIVLIILIRMIRNIVTRPVKAAGELANALASGDLDKDISIKSEDEIGQLAKLLDKEVRDAFKNIVNARRVADKQAKYQSGEVDKLLINLQRLARGELLCDIVVDTADQDTEALYELFNKIAMNMSSGISAIKDYIDEISYVLSEMANGNMCVGISSDYKGDFITLKESINTIAESLNSTLTEINLAAQQVASGTSQVSDGSQAISQGATEQAASIEELTSTVTEIAAQTRQNALSAGKANEMSEQAKDNAIKGNEQMKALQQAIWEINESSANISKIIKVIDDIAFQTNILALNAAVEAARAGIHGKGFAVVAEEVRNLAARSASAAKETTELIEGSIKKTAAGTKIADDTAVALTQIVEGVEKAVGLVAEIAGASNQQATAIGEVNRGIEQMSQVVQTNSAISQEEAAASEELSSQAAMLMEMVNRFKLRREANQLSLPDSPTGKLISQDKPSIEFGDRDFGKY